MPCYRPLQGYRARYVNENGKRPIVFNRADGFEDLPVELACGRCIGCRLERSRQWAIRCVHEASLYEQNSFITLTYSPEFLPQGGTLIKRDFQLFMKRLRKEISPFKVRFFHCGEYGGQYGRPHYHALLFGFDFVDKVFLKTTDAGEDIYTSELLSKLWPYGHCSIGAVTFKSAAYVARYILDKVTGDDAFLHYVDIDDYTGEILNERLPEYVTMSRRPGIGRIWYDKFKDDVFPRDEVIIGGRKVPPPKFYDEIYKSDDLEGFKIIKSRRKKRASLSSEDIDGFRLRAKEAFKKTVLSRFKRGTSFE